MSLVTVVRVPSVCVPSVLRSLPKDTLAVRSRGSPSGCWGSLYRKPGFPQGRSRPCCGVLSPVTPGFLHRSCHMSPGCLCLAADVPAEGCRRVIPAVCSQTPEHPLAIGLRTRSSLPRAGLESLSAFLFLRGNCCLLLELQRKENMREGSAS